MPSYVIAEKCDGCKAQARTACQYVCPNDLMALDTVQNKAYNQEPDACWECYSCVKICPQGAVAVRGYADFVPLGAQVTPLRGTDSIMWTVKFRDGRVKRFRFPIRTTPEGSIKVHEGLREPTDAALRGPMFCDEPETLGIPALPMRK